MENDYCRRLKYNRQKIGIVTSTFFIHDREVRIKKKLTYQKQVHHVFVNQLATLVDINRNVFIQYIVQFYKIFEKILLVQEDNSHISKLAFVHGSFNAQLHLIDVIKFRKISKQEMAYIDDSNLDIYLK